jgi:hypothetical protein
MEDVASVRIVLRACVSKEKQMGGLHESVMRD